MEVTVLEESKIYSSVHIKSNMSNNWTNAALNSMTWLVVSEAWCSDSLLGLSCEWYEGEDRNETGTSAGKLTWWSNSWLLYLRRALFKCWVRRNNGSPFTLKGSPLLAGRGRSFYQGILIFFFPFPPVVYIHRWIALMNRSLRSITASELSPSRSERVESVVGVWLSVHVGNKLSQVCLRGWQEWEAIHRLGLCVRRERQGLSSYTHPFV